MPTAHTFLIFSAAAIALLTIPGPSVLYIVTQSVMHGRRGGLVGMLGVQTGGLVHVVAASLGLSAIIASSATAFSIVKYSGAAYLVWLGIARLRSDGSMADPVAQPTRSLVRVYRQGFVVNTLNPKTALFFLAVLPQFVDPARGTVWLQSLALGALFIAIAMVSDGIWAFAAGWVSSRLQSRRARSVERYGTAGVLIGLGIAAALTEPSR